MYFSIGIAQLNRYSLDLKVPEVHSVRLRAQLSIGSS